jgi:hypothetical protein
LAVEAVEEAVQLALLVALLVAVVAVVSLWVGQEYLHLHLAPLVQAVQVELETMVALLVE